MERSTHRGSLRRCALWLRPLDQWQAGGFLAIGLQHGALRHHALFEQEDHRATTCYARHHRVPWQRLRLQRRLGTERHLPRCDPDGRPADSPQRPHHPCPSQWRSRNRDRSCQCKEEHCGRARDFRCQWPNGWDYQGGESQTMDCRDTLFIYITYKGSRQRETAPDVRAQVRIPRTHHRRQCAETKRTTHQAAWCHHPQHRPQDRKGD